MTKPSFEVSRKGLGDLLERRGREFAVLELLQNAFDEPGVTKVALTLQPESRGYHRLVVEDDAPEGFYDLSHAFTLFAPNRKRANAEKRGRFNLGEKLVIAICREASIVTTSGGVAWNGDGRRSLRTRTDVGSRFEGSIRMNRDEGARALDAAQKVIVPDGVSLAINGRPVTSMIAERTIEVTLPTEYADDEGVMRPTRRKTTVTIYEPGAYEPMLYEMGIPVVESGLPWHVDIGQRVPMPMDRDNVSPAYARKLRAAVLNEMHRELPKDAAGEGWVKDALASGDLSEQAINTTLDKLVGPKRVIRDPSDPEGTKRAMAEGYAVIEPRTFTRDQWKAIKDVGAAKPAGQVTPSKRPKFANPGDPNATDPTVPPKEWTDDMLCVVKWIERLGAKLIDMPLEVDIVRSRSNMGYQAWFRAGEPRMLVTAKLTLNLQCLGHKWFRQVNEDTVSLVIHELGHQYSGDHLSKAYHDALCQLGARLGKLALEEPDVLRGWA